MNPHIHLFAGLDGILKFWDVRNTTTPILSIDDCREQRHSHWITSVSYNRCTPFLLYLSSQHDQLVLSSSTDATVLLHSVVSISSASSFSTDTEEPTSSIVSPGGLSTTIDEDDAVYEYVAVCLSVCF